MKTLYIIRHAKSSWDDPALDDFDRPLNERGKTDAPRMGKRLKEKDVHPGAVISSPAKRAFSTAKRICEAVGFPKNNIVSEPKLYHASSTQIISVITTLPDKYDNVFIFGHNPGFTDFVNEVGNVEIDNIPTCGVIVLSFPMSTWDEIDEVKGDLLFFDYPKSQKD
jgi:phosphohistidine phosphatase